MRTLKNFLKTVAVFMIFALGLTMQAVADGDPEFADPAPFNGKRIGVQTGSTTVDLAKQVFDQPQLVYFSNTPDMAAALKSNKIDAILHDEPNMRYLAGRIGGIKVGKLKGFTDSVAELFPKTEEGKRHRDEMSEFILRMKENGELKKLEDKWFNGSDEEQVMEDYRIYPDINGTLVIATDPTYAPFQFISDNLIVGYETEIVALFCRAYGYRPEFVTCEFTGMITGITMGKYDMVASGLVITEERKESVYFSEPICEAYYGIAYLEEDASSGSSIVDSFRKTFLVEDRWKDFLAGGLVTIGITVASILAGTALGFAWYLLYRRENRIVTAVSDAVLWVIDGIPTVVFLMILFYIVFSNSAISGTAISVIGFSLLFACFMIGALKAGEKAVDRGQYLAADALGYGNTMAFFRIIFPQAAKHVWPAYIAEISSHVKATSVVGYITVVDITKAGDLIRGRTYSPFFPLFSVVAAYFVMTAVLQGIARLIERRTDPFRRSEEEILGGAVIR